MTDKVTKYLKLVEPWHVLMTLLVFVVGGIFAANAWVQKIAYDAVLDEKFLTTLAARVRPVCIFDSNGAIEADLGAMEYIEDIHVIPAPQIYGFKIVVKAKRHLAYAPLVTGLDLDLHPQAATRGKLHTWNIMLSPASTTESITTGEPMNTTKLHRFRLEILH